jgi:hypothetical protein
MPKPSKIIFSASVCEKHHCNLEVTKYGDVCRLCIAEITKANTPRHTPTGVGVRCAACGMRVKPPAILRNGIGPCCNPVPVTIPVVVSVEPVKPKPPAEFDYSSVAEQMSDLSGIAFDPQSRFINPADMALLSGYVNAIAGSAADTPMPDDLPNDLADGVAIRDKRGILSKYETDALPDMLPPMMAPAPKIKTKSLIVNLNGEVAELVLAAIEAMRIQFDQANADEALLLAIVCREWLKGNGREKPPERPQGDF